MKKHENISTFLFGLIIYAIVAVAVFSVSYIVDVVKDYSSKQETASENRDYYYEGYDEGYYAGYDDGNLMGHSEGYDEGFDLVREAEWTAVEYAIENCRWCPEEAMSIIDAYENGEAFYEDGAPPSKEDYKEAVRSLYYFYDYFYCGMYDELKDYSY